MKFLLERSRYLVYIGIISLLVASFAAFAWGVIKIVSIFLIFFLIPDTFNNIVTNVSMVDTVFVTQIIGAVDAFLIAATLLIFSTSIYELFIGKLDLPKWMLAHNLYELKAKLSSMIILVMAVKFLQKLLDINDAMALLQTGIAVAVVSAALIAFGYFGKKD